MVLYIDQNEIKGVPPSTIVGLYALSKRLKSEGRAFPSIPVKEIEAKDALYVSQREFAVCDSNRSDGFTYLGTDDCTSCLAFILRDMDTHVNAIAHLDSPFCNISEVIARAQQLNTKILEAEKERGQSRSDSAQNNFRVQLVGSFGSTGEPIIASVLKQLSVHSAKFDLSFCCVGNSNTIFRGTKPWPGVYGVCIDRVSGEVLPARFPEKGPDMALRTVRNLTGERSLLEIYDFERKVLKIGPFAYSTIPCVVEILTQTDESIKIIFSTTPEVEPPHFVQSIKDALEFFEMHPTSESVFKGKAKLYSKVWEEEWRPISEG